MKFSFFYTIIIVLLFLSFNKNIFSQADSEIIMDKYKATIIDNGDSFYGVYLVKKGRKMGVIDYDFELKIPIKYESIRYYEEYNPFYIVQRKKHYGLYNNEFNLILECKYTKLERVGAYIEIGTKKGIGLYSLESQNYLIEPIYDSIAVSSDFVNYNEGITVLYSDGKQGMVYMSSDYIVKFDVEWDSIKFVDSEIYDVDGEWYSNYYSFKKEGDIFCYTLDGEDKIEIITEGYSSVDKKRLQKLKADTIALDGNNGDGMFKARIASSKKWGLYQDYGDTIHVKIPPQFDSIINYSWNAPFTMVANDGLWGVYLWEWGDSIDYNREVPCLYQECKRVSSSSSGRFYMAAKLDNVWFWVDWYTGKRTTKQVWKTYDEMTLSFYDRSTYYSN